MPKENTFTINTTSNLNLLNTQIVKFYYEDNRYRNIEDQINEFLQDNPSCTVQNVSLGVSDYKTICAVTYQQRII